MWNQSTLFVTNITSGIGSDAPSNALAEKFKSGDHINILLFGTDGGRSDTMMVLSYDPKNKLADLISIPRDTYNHVDGKDKIEQRKMNAVYGFKGDYGGSEGLKREISKLLGVPVNYYVELDYKAVANVIDTIGGIEVDIPYKMDYDDPYCNPPLHIHFKPGVQTLDGQQAMEYLRWRGNNDGSHSNGDLDRVKRQQEFVVTASKKALSIKLPLVIKDVFNDLETDMNLGDMVYMSTQLLGFDVKNINKHTLPGTPGMKYKASFFFHDTDATLTLIKTIYERKPNEIS